MSKLKKNDTGCRKIYEVPLPKDFQFELGRVFDDEIDKDTEKWGIVLDDNAKQNIKKHALRQLENKVSVLSAGLWNLDCKTIKVHIENPSEIPTVEKCLIEQTNKCFVYVDFSYSLARKSGYSTYKDFPNYLLGKIFDYYRTAIFYGVASYAL